MIFDSLEQDIHLNYDDFDYFRKCINKLSGIYMSDSKKELVKCRLRPRVFTCGLSTFSEYRNFLQNLPPENKEWEAFVNLLTTNKTDFFREPNHFQFMNDVIIPHWLSSGKECFKVWSAASSTGEEAYTTSMTLERSLNQKADYKIIGSDIDTNVLKAAKNAVYSISKLREIPEDFHSAIDIGKGDISDWMRIKPHLREKVSFCQHNLIDDENIFKEEFDLIFCRNVMIYFTPQTIEVILKKLYAAARLNAFLFIGHSESIQKVKTDWKYVSPSIYTKGNQKIISPRKK